jgi:hypothetical protein
MLRHEGRNNNLVGRANAEMKRDTTRRNEVLKRDTFPLFIVHKYAHGYGVWFVYGKTMKKLHPSFKTRT